MYQKHFFRRFEIAGAQLVKIYSATQPIRPEDYPVFTGGLQPVGQRGNFLSQQIEHFQRHPAGDRQPIADFGLRVKRVGKILLQRICCRKIIRIIEPRRSLETVDRQAVIFFRDIQQVVLHGDTPGECFTIIIACQLGIIHIAYIINPQTGGTGGNRGVG